MRGLILVATLGALAGCDDPQPSHLDSSGAEKGPVLEVLATGANISGANGIHFGPDGFLYVASVVGSNITVLDPNSGEIVRTLTAVDGVIGPDDVAFAPDGSYFWTSILTGEVAGFNATGERIQAAQLPPGPNPITFSDDGRLFVAQCFLGSNLYELDPNGQQAPRIIADDLGPGCGLNGMDWGPDGRLYGPRWFTGEVVSFDVDTSDRRTEVGGFTTPAAVKFDSEGVLHVLDTGAGEVVQIKDDGKTVIANFEPGLDNFAFDKNDTLFVSSFVDGFVKRVNADGSQTTLQPGGMAHPGGVAVAGGLVWVADLHAIRGFDPKTGEEKVVQRNIVGVGKMGGAMNLSADGENLILSSWFDGDVRVWNPTTETRLAHYPGLAGPVAAVRYGDGVAISEHMKGSVTLYSDGNIEVLASNLPAPTALVASGSALYVSDRELGQILMVAQNGKPLSEPKVMVSNLASPEGFVIVKEGFVVVEADATNVVLVNAVGERKVLASFASGSMAQPGTPPSQMFNGIAADDKGNLYLTGETARVLYRIQM